MKAVCEICGKTGLNIRDDAPTWGVVVCSDQCRYIIIGFEIAHHELNLDLPAMDKWLKELIKWSK